MIAIPIFQVLAFTVYVLYIVKKFGVLPSISESWYSEGKMKYLFVIFIISISVPTLLLFHYSLWFLASGGFLLAVAFAPAFKSNDRIVGVIHSTGTIGGIVFALWPLVTHGIYIPAILCVIFSILLERLKIANTTWWVEIANFTAIEFGIFQLIK